MEKLMNTLLEMYNNISDDKLDYETIGIIVPKLKLIQKENNLDEFETIEAVDALLEFNKKHQLDKINKETIGMYKRMTDSEVFELERSLYFSINLKHLLIPYNINKCDKEEDELFHISKFETVLDMIITSFEIDDYNMLSRYNYELSELALLYKKVMDYYREKVKSEIVLNIIISHMFAIFYFNQEEYNKDYTKLETGMINAIENYQDVINYCYSEGICENFAKEILDSHELEKEYAVCKKMLDYIFKDKEKEMVKR